MTKTEAIGLETICEGYFNGSLESATISMALNGKLRIESADIKFTFDYNTGDFVYVTYNGYYDELLEIQAEVKEICADAEKREMLNRLAWSYEHIYELTDDTKEA